MYAELVGVFDDAEERRVAIHLGGEPAACEVLVSGFSTPPTLPANCG